MSRGTAQEWLFKAIYCNSPTVSDRFLKMQRDLGLRFLEGRIGDLQVLDDRLDAVELGDEREEEVAVEFVADRPVERHRALFHVEMDAAHVGQFEVAFKGLIKPERERLVFERRARVADRSPSKAVRNAFYGVGIHKGLKQAYPGGGFLLYLFEIKREGP